MRLEGLKYQSKEIAFALKRNQYGCCVKIESAVWVGGNTRENPARGPVQTRESGGLD